MPIVWLSGIGFGKYTSPFSITALNDRVSQSFATVYTNLVPLVMIASVFVATLDGW